MNPKPNDQAPPHENRQTSLLRDFEAAAWPPEGTFPLNEAGSSAGKVVQADLADSSSFLVVTGFTSLAYLIKVFGQVTWRSDQRADIVLGITLAKMEP